MLESIPGPLEKTPQVPYHFFPKQLPSPTILTMIFGVLLVSVIGMGTAVVMSGNTPPSPVAVPTLTPTPDPTSEWQEYNSSFYGLNLKVPPDWRIQEGGGMGDNSLYFHSDEVVGNTNTRYYVYVTTLPNPENLSLQQALSSYYSLDVPFAEEQLGENTLFLSTRVPSRQGALSAFFPMVGSSDYLTLSLTPYESELPLPEQERYEEMFRLMLSSVSLSQVASPSLGVVSTPFEVETSAPSYWKTYIDRQYPFSFDYPPDYILDTSRQGRVLVGNQVEVVVTPVDPAKCTGVCPVREKTTNVVIQGHQAKKYEGYLTSDGGQIPQRYLQYVFQERSLYYMFTLYEVGRQVNLSPNRSPQSIPPEDIQLFEQIIATLRFR